MKVSNLLMTSSLVAAVSGPALAQGTPFSQIDTNGDGVLSLSELVAVFGEDSAQRIILRADRDGDGELTRFEIRVRNDDESDDEEDDEEGDESDEEDDEEGDESSDEEDDSDESSDEEDDSDESSDEEDDED